MKQTPFKKGTFAYAEHERAQIASKTPRVDAILDGKIKYSYQYAYEMTELAKALEMELAAEKVRSANLETIIKSAKHDKKKVLCETSVQTAKKKKVSGIATAFDALSNDEVMERLRQFGFGSR